MADHPIGGRPLSVTFANQLSPRNNLVFLLSGVRTIEQHDDWKRDWGISRHLLTFDEQIEVAVFGGWRKADILRGEVFREFV